MTHLRRWLIAAALLPAPLSSGLAAEPLEEIYAAVKADSASPGMVHGKASGGRLGLMDVLLASHAVQPRQRMEVGFGLGDDAIVNGSMDWYGVYLQSLDRVAEGNTIYGLLRESPRRGPKDSTMSTAFCCTRSDSPTPRGLFSSTIAARQVSPTLYLFGMLRKKGLNINLEDGWALHAGVRPMQYNSVLETKVRFVTVERYWDSFRTSYSFELERSSGVSVAPSHVLQFDYLYGSRDSIGISFTNGREVAYFGPLSILNTEVHSVAVRGQHLFKQDWALTFQAGYNDHGSLPAQAGVRMGLRHSF